MFLFSRTSQANLGAGTGPSVPEGSEDAQQQQRVGDLAACCPPPDRHNVSGTRGLCAAHQHARAGIADPVDDPANGFPAGRPSPKRRPGRL